MIRILMRHYRMIVAVIAMALGLGRAVVIGNHSQAMGGGHAAAEGKSRGRRHQREGIERDRQGRGSLPPLIG